MDFLRHCGKQEITFLVLAETFVSLMAPNEALDGRKVANVVLLLK